MSFLAITNLILFVVGLVNLVLGLIVVLSTRNRGTAQKFFAVLAFTVACWTLSMAFYRYTTAYAFLALHILYVVPLVIPVLFVYFADAYAKEQSAQPLHVILKKFLLLVATLLACFVAFSDTIVQGIVIPVAGEKIIIFGSLYFLYVAYFILTFTLGYLFLLTIYLHADKQLVRQQALFLFLGTSLSGAIALITNLLLPWFGYFVLNWFGNFATVFFIGFIFYATAFRKLFNLRIVAAEMFLFVLWTVLIIRVALSRSTTEFIIEIIILSASVLLGILLIRSVSTEIENREKGERLARYLANANARLRELDRQKTEFISIASHQLRSPIAAIKGYASMVVEGSFGPVPDNLSEPLGRILESGKRIAIMVDDFLNVSRIEQGRMGYALHPVDLVPLVHEVVDELRIVAEGKGLSLSLEVSAGGKVMVLGDESKLRQVFLNILDNAIKYTKEGSVHMMLAIIETHKAAFVEIADSGIGIPLEEQGRLFHKFARATNANEATVYGTGLGLYIAREIIKSHNGWIHITSSGAGKGTTFTIELPLAGEDGTVAPEEIKK